MKVCSISNGISSASMNDLKCPFCPKEFNNMPNRDKRTAACHQPASASEASLKAASAHAEPMEVEEVEDE